MKTRTEQINVRLKPGETREIDKIAQQLGLTRSALARMALTNIKIVSRPAVGVEINAPTKVDRRRASA